jgi:hypothetical protein
MKIVKTFSENQDTSKKNDVYSPCDNKNNWLVTHEK